MTDELVTHPAPEPPAEPAPPRSPAIRRRVIAGLVIPGALFGLGLALLATGRTSALDLGLLAGMYAATMLGITMGYHRLFTHRSFKAHRAVRLALGVLGAMAGQGMIGVWASVHRRHHQLSNREGDPHSPHVGTAGLAGLWHAHVGWIVDFDVAGWERHVPDLLKDPDVQAIDRVYPRLILLGLLLPGVVGGLLGGSWLAALTGFLWGGPIRLFLVFNGTWLVNSSSHMLGARPYATHDHSTNNALLAPLTLGESWHNNHHAFPASARHGLAWWQFDPTYCMIATGERLGLVSDVIRIEPATLEARRRGPSATDA